MKIKDLFTVPKNQKITEKQFLRVLISSVCSIMLCLVCLVSTTWAWFSLSITSQNNTIQVGMFDVDVTVLLKETEAPVPASGDNTYQLSAGTYTVHINSNSANTAPGYCVVKLDATEYKTIRLYPVGSGEEKPSAIVFDITVSAPVQQVASDAEEGTENQPAETETSLLQIIPMWGDPGTDGDLLGTGISIEVAEETEDTTDQTDPSTEPEETTAPATTEQPAASEETTVPATTEQTTTPEETTAPATTEQPAASEETTVPATTEQTTTPEETTAPDTTEKPTETEATSNPSEG